MVIAIDESNATCKKRFDGVGIECTEENRRAYRELLAAGIRPGDVITDVAGRPIGNVSELLTNVAALKPGTEVPFKLAQRSSGARLDDIAMQDLRVYRRVLAPEEGELTALDNVAVVGRTSHTSSRSAPSRRAGSG